MSQGELARRMDVSQKAVSQLERREAVGSATLNALEQAARALDCEFVYALEPRRSIQETLEARALRLAQRMLGSVRHSMRLEDQEPQSGLEERTRALATELMASPDRLWAAALDE
jgi:predicted DNA-binding mobile mystery protein A